MPNTVEAKTFNSNDKEYKQLIEKAKQNQEFNTTIRIREDEGFTVDQEAVVQEFTIPAEKKTAYVIIRSVRKNNIPVGEITLLDTDGEDNVFSKVEADDNKVDLIYFENGELKHQILEHEEMVETLGMTKKQCKVLVAAICKAGLATSVSGCAAGCTTLGPAYVVCWPFCVALVAVGCHYGSDAACAWVD